MIISNQVFEHARDLSIANVRAVLSGFERIDGTGDGRRWQYARPGWVWVSDEHLAALQALPSDDVRAQTIACCPTFADDSPEAAAIKAGTHRVTVGPRLIDTRIGW